MNPGPNKTNPDDLGSDWKKTQYANPAPDVPSGTHFVRMRVRGKLIRKSLETDVISVAKLSLADFVCPENAAPADSGGRMAYIASA